MRGDIIANGRPGHLFLLGKDSSFLEVGISTKGRTLAIGGALEGTYLSGPLSHVRLNCLDESIDPSMYFIRGTRLTHLTAEWDGRAANRQAVAGRNGCKSRVKSSRNLQ